MSDFEGIEFVEAVAVAPLPGYRLWLRFSNGSEGIVDISDWVADGGPVFRPLQDQSFFDRVFLDTDVPAWPNGLDLDATNLHLRVREQQATGVAAE